MVELGMSYLQLALDVAFIFLFLIVGFWMKTQNEINKINNRIFSLIKEVIEFKDRQKGG